MSLFPDLQKVNAEVFGEAEYGVLCIYIEDKIKYLKTKCKGIREDLMPKWTRIYRGVPAEKNKTWPWPGASNLVVQVAGMFSDELLSRVMAMYASEPLFNAKLLGDFDAETNNSAADQALELEYFLQDCAYEPEELDLYRVEETGYSSAIRFGTGVFKFPWQYVVEQQATYIGGGTEEGTKATYDWSELVRRDGPHPEAVPLADWSIDPKFANLEQADAKVHTLHLDYHELERWKEHKEIFDVIAIDEILKNPDKIPEYRMQLEEQKEVQNSEQGNSGKNYDIEELWFTYNKDGKIYRLLAFWHEATEKHIGCVFNMYPDNIEPFEDAKLAYDDDTYFGYGFCEMLESYQREVSTTHNWRVDNRHFATTGAGRVNKNSKLASILTLYPGVLIPADEGEIEALTFGQNAMQYTTEDEQQTLMLAAQRAGVDPASGGSGGATVNAKKGIVSAQGTAMSMQSQNNRNNLRMSDMRSCHVRMGRKLLKMYSHFGLGNKIRKYGNRAETIKAALANYKSGKLGLVIKPSTASLNKEMEKQNDVLLSATLERLYQTDMQAMQMLSQPSVDPQMADLIKKQIRARNSLCRELLLAFDKNGVERLLAVPQFMLDEKIGAVNGSQQQNNARITNGSVQPQGQAQGMVPLGAGNLGGAVPVQ